jgi:Tfp pilus assembly protein PilF
VAENQNDVDARLMWAQTTLLLKEYEQARRIVDGGVTLSADPRLTALSTAIHTARADALLQQDSPDYAGAFQELSDGLQVSPLNGAVLNRLSVLAHGNSDYRQHVLNLLEELVAETSEESPAVFLVLGTIATDTQQHELAAAYFRRGRALAPAMPELANNLAWSLMHTDPPQLEQALELAREAVERGSPDPRNMAEFRNTYGMILCRLGHWQEAIAQLELASKTIPPGADVHVALAEAYENLGMPDTAAVHRKMAGSRSDGAGDADSDAG